MYLGRGIEPWNHSMVVLELSVTSAVLNHAIICFLHSYEGVHLNKQKQNNFTNCGYASCICNWFGGCRAFYLLCPTVCINHFFDGRFYSCQFWKIALPVPFYSKDMSLHICIGFLSLLEIRLMKEETYKSRFNNAIWVAEIIFQLLHFSFEGKKHTGLKIPQENS